MNKKFLLILSALVLLPTLTMAQISSPPGAVGGSLTTFVANFIVILLNILWMIAVAFFIIMFVLAGFKFMTAQGDPSKVAEARNAVIWGVAGVVVAILAFSVISFVRVQLGV